MSDLLNIFYVPIGFLMLFIAYKSFITIEDERKFETSSFWGFLGILFVFGDYIAPNVVGLMLVLMSLFTGLKRITIAKYLEPDAEFSEIHAKRLRNKIFLPSLVLVIASVSIGSYLFDVVDAPYFAVGAGSFIALLVAFIITKPKLSLVINDSAKLLQQIGSVSILPQLLVTVAVLFVQLGASEIFIKYISINNKFIGVVIYCISMAIFSYIVGNIFVAFTVVTICIGGPVVISQGGDPAIIGAIGFTAGYCGILMTPMAGNINVVPVALMDMKDDQAVIKTQTPIAIILLILHILAMYFFGF